MFSSSLIFKRKRNGELCKCYLECIFLLCGLSTISVVKALKYLTTGDVMKHHLSVILQLIFKLERNHHKSKESILNDLSRDIL